jgi:hypothetical protein
VEPPADQRGHPGGGPHLVLHPAVCGRALLEIRGQFLQAVRGRPARRSTRATRGQSLRTAVRHAT